MTLAATASRLLTKYGEAVSLSYVAGGSVDPATGVVVTPQTPVAVSGFGYPSRYEKSEVDGAVIRHDDVRLVLEKVSERPQSGWKATVDGKAYRVMDVRPVRRSAADVIYICQCRSQ